MDLAEFVRTRASRVRNPSRRTPIRGTDFNNADNVERQLAQDSHQIWGWVIYRCTYESDAEWTEFMSGLQFYIRETLVFENGLDILDSLDYHIFDDRAQFEGAHPSQVRDHFRGWVKGALEREQGRGAKLWRSQRYKYCLHVDREALQSVIAGPAPPGDNLGDGFVNLVNLKPDSDGGMRAEVVDEVGEDEGGRCWMRIAYHGLMVGRYSQMRKQGSWSTEYRAPPEVGHR